MRGGGEGEGARPFVCGDAGSGGRLVGVTRESKKAQAQATRALTQFFFSFFVAFFFVCVGLPIVSSVFVFLIVRTSLVS